jgi:hypothetical protein
MKLGVSIPLSLMFICAFILSIPLKYNQKDAKFARSIYLYKLLHMFQAVSPPSSGAQNCTYSARYCQTNTAAIVDEMELHAISISSTIAAGSAVLV